MQQARKKSRIVAGFVYVNKVRKVNEQWSGQGGNQVSQKTSPVICSP